MVSILFFVYTEIDSHTHTYSGPPLHAATLGECKYWPYMTVHVAAGGGLIIYIYKGFVLKGFGRIRGVAAVKVAVYRGTTIYIYINCVCVLLLCFHKVSFG